MLKRWIIGVPFAAAVTTALGLGMIELISAEFKVQPKREALNFEINPVVIGIQLPPERTKPKALQRVDIPPSMPLSEHPDQSLPTVPIVTPDAAIPEFKPAVLDPFVIPVGGIDRNPDPIFRVGGAMPPRATKSGYCKMRFDVSPAGIPFNVEAVSCSQSLFARNSVKATQEFKYRPRLLRGQPVVMRGLETIIRYNLVDANGRTIPE